MQFTFDTRSLTDSLSSSEEERAGERRPLQEESGERPTSNIQRSTFNAGTAGIPAGANLFRSPATIPNGYVFSEGSPTLDCGGKSDATPLSAARELAHDCQPRSESAVASDLPAQSKRLIPSILFAVLILLLASHTAHARINVVTLPARDSVQLTIYNSVDLTLVKETRVLTFRQGINKLEFSWANTLIDPTSVEFKALTHADAVDVLDVSFPPRVSNTLEWRIQSAFAGEVTVEIRYFTSGIKWAADYVAEAARNEKTMALAGQVRVTNNSGEDYENAQIRLVVGVIRLVEEIITLARDRGEVSGPTPSMTGFGQRLKQNVNGAFGGGVKEAEELAQRKPKDIVKEGLSEYFLYTVEGRDTIPNGWAKRLPSFSTPNVPVTSYYKFEKERWADQVMRYYRFTNSEPSTLGREPLPDGDVKAFRLVTDDKLYAFVGRATVKYIPVQETVEMELGSDREVLVKPTLVNWTKTDLAFDNFGNVKGWTTRESWEIEVQNSKDIDVMLDVRRNFSGDWSLDTTASFEKVDATKVKFVLPLKSRAQQKFAYELTVRHGTNATK